VPANQFSANPNPPLGEYTDLVTITVYY